MKKDSYGLKGLIIFISLFFFWPVFLLIPVLFLLLAFFPFTIFSALPMAFSMVSNIVWWTFLGSGSYILFKKFKNKKNERNIEKSRNSKRHNIYKENPPMRQSYNSDSMMWDNSYDVKKNSFDNNMMETEQYKNYSFNEKIDEVQKLQEDFQNGEMSFKEYSEKYDDIQDKYDY